MNDEPEFERYEADPFVRQFVAQGIRNAAILLVVIATVWTGLGFLPDGWWHLVINIGAVLITCFIGVSIKSSLVALGNPQWLAWGISVVICFVAVIVVRSIESAILEAVFQ